VATLALTNTGDLAFTAGRLTLLRGADETAQRLRQKFLLVKGEWFLDTRIGVPYFALMGVKNPNLESIRRTFRSIILSEEAISEIESLTVDLNRATRELTFAFRAIHNSGVAIVGGSGVPFVVEQ
jgi:hypothetical protein